MEENENDDEYINCKVVLVGEPGVGKTSIISRYIYNQFSESVVSSTGASYAKKVLEIDNENKIKFQIWDTAGQERFRSLAKIFYQNASAVIIVYDITVRETFEKIKEYWIKEIKDNAPTDIIMAIAGNKNDNYEFEKVTPQEGQDLAKENDAIFQSTSARSSQGIDDLFKNIGKRFIYPNNGESSTVSKEDFQKSIKLKKNKNKNKEEKRKCCK